ncbi:MAG TPA: c-type cytochrome [Albitalea sp.]|uniref:c-type cytochrome n=1 Tax=Piscinibacter sp. TaxID=1903157 RepID=UPI002ED228ED
MLRPPHMRARPVIVTLTAAALLAAAAGACIVFGGVYDVSATRQHTQVVYTLLEETMHSSVRERAAGIEPPPLSGDAVLARGLACYREHCLQCHGAPGVPPGPIGKSMQPLPGSLIDAARRWRERELYWITRHGIKMSGMPAWEMRLSDADLWAVVAVLVQLPQWSPAEYATRAAAAGATCSDAPGATPSQRLREQGARALREYACIGCHTIPGLTGSDTQVGPPLQGLASRSMIAGRLVNNADNLVQWIRAPQAVKPGTAMPDMGVTEAHARQMAAYLATLH